MSILQGIPMKMFQEPAAIVSYWHIHVSCPMSHVRCPMSDVPCPMSHVPCPMSHVPCLMSHVRCPMSYMGVRMRSKTKKYCKQSLDHLDCYELLDILEREDLDQKRSETILCVMLVLSKVLSQLINTRFSTGTSKSIFLVFII